MHSFRNRLISYRCPEEFLKRNESIFEGVKYMAFHNYTKLIKDLKGLVYLQTISETLPGVLMLRYDLFLFVYSFF